MGLSSRVRQGWSALALHVEGVILKFLIQQCSSQTVSAKLSRQSLLFGYIQQRSSGATAARDFLWCLSGRPLHCTAHVGWSIQWSMQSSSYSNLLWNHFTQCLRIRTLWIFHTAGTRLRRRCESPSHSIRIETFRSEQRSYSMYRLGPCLTRYRRITPCRRYVSTIGYLTPVLKW